VLNFIAKLYGYILKIFSNVTMVFLVLLVIVNFINVISRYFIGSSIAWSEEASRFLFIWIIAMGGVLINSKDEHLRFTFLRDNTTKPVKIILTKLVDVITIIIMTILLMGWKTLIENYIDWKSSALEVSYGKIYMILPICATIIVIQTIVRVFERKNI